VALSAARIERLSIISMAAGTIPAATIADTTAPASAVESKKATWVLTVSGTGMTRSVTLVVTPSVPSEPTNTPTRSSPGWSSALPPSATSWPSASTTSRPVT
jgi:hypothetical protein